MSYRQTSRKPSQREEFVAFFIASSSRLVEFTATKFLQHSNAHLTTSTGTLIQLIEDRT